ncbi:hypothetical protein, partial [Streptomyces sp. cmx-4-25]|uniref:hypothetical protein n=1 Tax=Streptomyces sp. cmx-4-25 TaxID=2790933 RepID=UPI0039815F9E
QPGLNWRGAPRQGQFCEAELWAQFVERIAFRDWSAAEITEIPRNGECERRGAAFIASQEKPEREILAEFEFT